MTYDGMVCGEPLRFRLEVRSGRTRLFRDEILLAEGDAPGLAPSLFGWRVQPARGDDGLLRCGTELARAFVPPPVAAALGAALALARQQDRMLELAVEPDETAADLPWETLCLPGLGPLALHPTVALVRHVAGACATDPAAIPGPLRILVAIGSPEAQNPRGELLDMEAELGRILDATDQPRRAGKVFVRILETGGVAAIRQALKERRTHILHISCHARPGALILETADGAEDVVDAARFWDEAIPDGEAPPLVVLAGCSTGRDGAPEDETGTGRLPGLARTLVERGVPAVIAMQASVGDDYATELMAGVYQALAAWGEPRPLAALAQVRRRLEEARQRVRPEHRPPPEWATPTLFTAAASSCLYDPAAPHEDLHEPDAPVFDEGVVVRRIGDLVGRRRDQRLIRRALRDPNRGGVLIHGIGGVGKSTLAAHILHQLAVADGALVVSVAGETNPDRLFLALAERLTAVGEHQIAAMLRELKRPWRERFEMMSGALLSRRPLLVLLDNFEDNLKEGVPSAELGIFLARWLTQPGLSRLLITSRYPFPLPDDAGDALEAFHLGPLSWAETRKLLWRLPGLAVLEAEDVQRAWEEVGGHPRALEFLDALLRGGQARFGDVSKRVRKHLGERGIANPALWCAGKAGDLDAALAETVTLAAADVLLDQLLERLADQPLARRLLFGAAVYRVPVDELGLIWQVGEPVTYPPDPERAARMEAIKARIISGQKNIPGAFAEELLTESEIDTFNRDAAECNRPPVEAPRDFVLARQWLFELSLLTPARYNDSTSEGFLVHRWTAAALVGRADGLDQEAWHHTAAIYWRWQAKTQKKVDNWLEACYHLRRIGDIKNLRYVIMAIVCELRCLGATGWEEQMLYELIENAATDSIELALAFHFLANNHRGRFQYETAIDLNYLSLNIFEKKRALDGAAICYYEISSIARDLDMLDISFNLAQLSLDNAQKSNSLETMIDAYQLIGSIHQIRGEFTAALEWTRKALLLAQEINERMGTATAFRQLGNILHDISDIDNAFECFRQSLAIEIQRGDVIGGAESLYGISINYNKRNDFSKFMAFNRLALSAYKTADMQRNVAICLHDRGAMHTKHGSFADGAIITLQSLNINIELKLQSSIQRNLFVLSRQRQALGTDAFQAIVADHCDAESAANVLSLIDQFEVAQQVSTPTEPAL